MKTESVISDRGQITLPKQIRERFGLKPGTKVSFISTPKGLLIQKGNAETSSIRDVFGVVKDKIPTDDYLRQIRGKAE